MHVYSSLFIYFILSSCIVFSSWRFYPSPMASTYAQRCSPSLHPLLLVLSSYLLLLVSFSMLLPLFIAWIQLYLNILPILHYLLCYLFLIYLYIHTLALTYFIYILAYISRLVVVISIHTFTNVELWVARFYYLLFIPIFYCIIIIILILSL